MNNIKHCDIDMSSRKLLFCLVVICAFRYPSTFSQNVFICKNIYAAFAYTEGFNKKSLLISAVSFWQYQEF